MAPVYWIYVSMKRANMVLVTYPQLSLEVAKVFVGRDISSVGNLAATQSRYIDVRLCYLAVDW